MRIYFISKRSGSPRNAFPGRRFYTKRGAALYLRARSCWDDTGYKIVETKIPPFGKTRRPLIETCFKSEVDVIEQANMLRI